MMTSFFNTILFDPLYNGLIFLIVLIPTGDVGIAVILFTIIVKLLMFPLSIKSARTQLTMREIDPKLRELKEQYKEDRAVQAQKIMELYRENNLNPFSSFLVMLIQIPVIIALYFVFVRSGLPELSPEHFYTFNIVPQTINMHFLGIMDISARSIPIAVLAGITQFIQGALVSIKPERKKQGTGSIREDFASSMHFQMRYVLPIIITIIAIQFPAAVALYWTTSNAFSIGQEYYIRKRVRKQQR